MKKQRPYIVSIAGFDPSGGAGIIADAKVFEQLKTVGLFVQTSNTIQTEDSFGEVKWESSDFIVSQLDTIIKRYNPKFFKIGLIENAEVLSKVIERIKQESETIVLWDPILTPTFSKDFNESRFTENIESIAQQLDFITPNLPEFQQLGLEQMIHFSSIYLKGGHNKDKVGKDIFYHSEKQYNLNPKLVSKLTKHGTGCIFSSAFIANMSVGYAPLKAAIRAKDYVTKRIISNNTLLAYHK